MYGTLALFDKKWFSKCENIAIKAAGKRQIRISVRYEVNYKALNKIVCSYSQPARVISKVNTK